MGLVVFAVIGLYLLISVAVVIGAIVYARRHGKSGARWGSGAALVMYLLVFWDHIPTLAAHKYYCEKEAGFWVYKTLDQWKAENPGVAETLVEKVSVTRQGEKPNFTDTYFLNERINKVVRESRVLPVLHVLRHEQEVVDAKTNQVMARYINFQAGYPNGLAGIAPPSAGLAALKFWLVSERCSDSGAHPQHDTYELRKQFSELEKQLTGRRK